MSDRPEVEAVDAAARSLVAMARHLVTELGRDMLRQQMAEAEKGEATADQYARACVEETWRRRMPALVAVHDSLAAALNVASPNVTPLASLTTEEPA